MKKRKILKRILLTLFAVFIIIQFFRIDKSTPTFDKHQDFIAITKPPKDIEKLLRNACYDCHSFETKYPSYSNVAPVSWWMENHIVEGRDHLNFSEWGSYKPDHANHKLEECAEEVEHKKMPLDSYTWTHGDAELSSANRKKLAEWFEGQMQGQGGY